MSVLMNMNQFVQSRFAGQLDLQSNPNPGILTCRLNPSSIATYEGSPGVPAGAPVKLVDLGTADNNGVPMVDVATSDNDIIIGVVVSSTKDGIFSPGQTIQVALLGAVMAMSAKTTMNRNQAVVADYTTPGQIIVPATGNYILGVTLDKAVNVGDLVRVLITANGTKYSGVST